MYSLEEAGSVIIEAGHQLAEKKLIERTWGNISARVSETEFLITPSGRDYSTITTDELVKVNIEDLSYEGVVRPSSEMGVHAAVYSMRPEANFIIHTHQFYASVLSAECTSTWVAPCADYAMPGSERLADNVMYLLTDFPECRSFLMARHGAVLMGADCEEAFALAEKLENDSKKVFDERVKAPETSARDNINISAVATDKNPYVAINSDPYVMSCCARGGIMRAYLDDFAQIAGPEIAVVDNKPNLIKGALMNRNAVLVKGVGAVCTGASQDDVDAVSAIVSKNAACECYVRRAKPLSIIDARIERAKYVNSYAKNKDHQVPDTNIGRSIMMRDLSGPADSAGASGVKPMQMKYDHVRSKAEALRENLAERILFRDLGSGRVNSPGSLLRNRRRRSK